MADDKRKEALKRVMEKKTNIVAPGSEAYLQGVPVIHTQEELDKLPDGSVYRTKAGGKIHLKPSKMSYEEQKKIDPSSVVRKGEM